MVEPDKKVVQYLDSLQVSRKFSSAPRLIKAFMEKRHRDKGENAQYRIRIREDIPQQRNGVDCGVFVCEYAERITRKATMDFRQEDMEEARKSMTKELLEGSINPQAHKRREPRSEEKPRNVEKKKAERKKGRAKKEEQKKVEKDRTDSEDRKDRINWPKANSNEWQRLE